MTTTNQDGSITVSNTQGLVLMDLAKTGADSLTNPLIILSLDGVEADRSLITKATFEKNEDGLPGGILWLQVEPTLRDRLSEAAGQDSERTFPTSLLQDLLEDLKTYQLEDANHLTVELVAEYIDRIQKELGIST